MALVTSAIAIGLHLQLGYSLQAAILVGLALFVGLSGFQAFWMSSAEQDALAAEVERLESELGRQPVSWGAELAQAPPPGSPIAGPISREPPTRPLEAPGAAMGAATVRTPPQTGPAMPPASPAPVPAAFEVPASTINEDDVEMLQRRIKAMLLEVTAAENERDRADPEPLAAAGVEASLAALRSAATTMRGADARAPVRPPVASQPPLSAVRQAPDPVEAAAAAQRRQVGDAIGAGRVDVFLEPIMGLNDHAARHYEVSIRIRGAAGEDLGTGENIVELAGRGLLPLFDKVRLERTASVAGRLAARGKDGSVFSATSSEALSDAGFQAAATGTIPANREISRKLVLSFTQADVRGFRAAEQRAVASLAALGFRFAITDLTDLDMNFEAMAGAGFIFAKLDAQVFLEGLPVPGGSVPAADVCRHLASLGYAVVVGNIADEATLAKIFGFGAVLGQGTLFGGRRPVKPDAIREGQAAA